MKKETRAYLIPLREVTKNEEKLLKNVSDFTNDEFIETCESCGPIITLERLEHFMNNDIIDVSDYYVRFIEVELHELDLANDIYDYSAE